MTEEVRAAMMGGVVAGALATAALLLGGVFVAVRQGPPPYARSGTLRAHGWGSRAGLFFATLAVGLAMVLAMRLVGSYEGWWPQNTNTRTPALVAIAALAAGVVAAGPARWWFDLLVCLAGGAAISAGLRAPLPATDNLALAVALDALALGPAAFLLQALVDRIGGLDRGRLARPLPLLALAAAFMPLGAIIFHFGIGVSAQQSGIVQAVLTAGALALVVLATSGGRLVLRGLGVLVALAMGVWLVLGRTLGWPLLTELAIACLLLAGLGAGLAALALPRLRSWWTPALVVLALVGAPVAAAALVQHRAFTAERPSTDAEDHG
jgi:hypothetical protein